jgi:hypothetical protein
MPALEGHVFPAALAPASLLQKQGPLPTPPPPQPTHPIRSPSASLPYPGILGFKPQALAVRCLGGWVEKTVCQSPRCVAGTRQTQEGCLVQSTCGVLALLS